MITHISKNDLLKLQGLLTLAESSYKKVQDCIEAAEEILVEEKDGHISEAVFGRDDFSAESICKRAGIIIIGEKKDGK